MPFQKATKQQSKLRMALIGPSGSGKTYSALKIASAMVKRIALIDTERGSASKYADKWNFDVLELASFSPERYMQAIHEAEQAGYELLIIDSLTHAWSGKDGALEMVDRAAKRSQSGNSFMAWREVTPVHNQLVDTILQASLHIIATMRTKTEYIQEKDERTGKIVPKKIGLAPVQRDGLEYEFDVIGDMTPDNELIISKSRCEALTGQNYKQPGAEVAAILKAWVSEGIAPTPKSQPPRTDLEELSQKLPAATAEPALTEGAAEDAKKMGQIIKAKYEAPAESKADVALALQRLRFKGGDAAFVAFVRECIMEIFHGHGEWANLTEDDKVTVGKHLKARLDAAEKPAEE